jgi:hypothetical protein
VIDRASEVLRALARSDVEALARLCSQDVLVVGTDEGELWHGRDGLVEAFRGAFDLEVEWADQPVVGQGWLFGPVVFTLPDGARTPARVTMVFENDLLVHAHYSAAVAA